MLLKISNAASSKTATNNIIVNSFIYKLFAEVMSLQILDHTTMSASSQVFKKEWALPGQHVAPAKISKSNSVYSQSQKLVYGHTFIF